MQIPITSCLNITPIFALFLPFRKMLYVSRSSVPNVTSTCAVIFILYIYIYIIKLNPGLPWQKLHLTRRKIFLPANWT